MLAHAASAQGISGWSLIQVLSSMHEVDWGIILRHLSSQVVVELNMYHRTGGFLFLFLSPLRCINFQDANVFYWCDISSHRADNEARQCIEPSQHTGSLLHTPWDQYGWPHRGTQASTDSLVSVFKSMWLLCGLNNLWFAATSKSKGSWGGFWSVCSQDQLQSQHQGSCWEWGWRSC